MNTICVMRMKFVRCLTAMVLCIQLFNFSIDPADKPGTENLTINQIESFLELLIENILGHGNVLKETEEGDDHSGQREGSANYLVAPNFIEFKSMPAAGTAQYHSYHPVRFTSLGITIKTPPPRSLMI